VKAGIDERCGSSQRAGFCVCQRTLLSLYPTAWVTSVRSSQAQACHSSLFLPRPAAADHPTKFEFENGIVGNAIPPNFIPACEKGFREAVNAGALIGHPVEVRRRQRGRWWRQVVQCVCAVEEGRRQGRRLARAAPLNGTVAAILAALSVPLPYLYHLAHLSSPAPHSFICAGPHCDQGVRVVLTDGAAHAVDSSELAFKLASMFAFK
jgi:hypothetical protein